MVCLRGLVIAFSVCEVGLGEGSLGRVCFVRELLCAEGALLGFGLAVAFDIFFGDLLTSESLSLEWKTFLLDFDFSKTPSSFLLLAILALRALSSLELS